MASHLPPVLGSPTRGETTGSGEPTHPTAGIGVDGSGPARRGRGYWSLSLPGLWIAVVFVCLSMTPSLLPRPGVIQGVIAGITGAIGYGVGVSGAWLWREIAGGRDPRPPHRWSWPTFAIGAGTLFAGSFLVGQYWQRETRALIGIGPEGLWSILLMPIVGALVFLLLLQISRGLRWIFRWLAGRLSRWIGGRLARVTGWLAVVVVAVLALTGVLFDGVIAVADRSFAVLDTRTNDEAHQPVSAVRSGGPGSLVSWESLGYQGRNFVGRGPTAHQIGEFNGSAAEEPIRAYAGLASATGDAEDRAALAVADLTRAGGFSRKYVLVAGTTGTGWVDPGALASLEYEVNGDVASVAIQYSQLPSWASVAVDQERAREAGRALFDAVYEKWSALPPAGRPKLLIFGESLGSFSIEAAFSGEADLRNRTSGGILAGAPWFNPLHREFTDRRAVGSPQIQPIYRDGRVVRFASDPASDIAAATPWGDSRILYLQHASDPITWLGSSLLFARPDWLAEPRGRDVNQHMVWLPVVTFWQVALDTLEPVDVPPGHGHRYTQEYVPGWAAIVGPSGWTATKSERLQQIVLNFEDVDMQ